MASHTDAHIVRVRGASKTGIAKRFAVVLAVSGSVPAGDRRAGDPAAGYITSTRNADLHPVRRKWLLARATATTNANLGIRPSRYQ